MVMNQLTIFLVCTIHWIHSVLEDDVQGMDDALIIKGNGLSMLDEWLTGDVAEDGEDDVDQQMNAAARLHEHTQRLKMNTNCDFFCSPLTGNRMAQSTLKMSENVTAICV